MFTESLYSLKSQFVEQKDKRERQNKVNKQTTKRL